MYPFSIDRQAQVCIENYTPFARTDLDVCARYVTRAVRTGDFHFDWDIPLAAAGSMQMAHTSHAIVIHASRLEECICVHTMH